MAPSPRVTAAFRAMKSIGVGEDIVKPVLKNLLKLYNKNWEIIEEENYRVLADTIFDYEEKERAEQKRKAEKIDKEKELEKEASARQELNRSPKRLRSRNEEHHSLPVADNSNPSLGGTSLVTPKTEQDETLDACTGLQPQDLVNKQKRLVPSKGKAPLSPFKKPMVEHHPFEKRMPDTPVLITPKDEPFTDGIQQFEIPRGAHHPESLRNGKSSIASGSSAEPGEKSANKQERSQIELEIASSSSGDVRISFRYDPVLGKAGFRAPNLDAVLKLLEDKYLGSYGINDQQFSVIEVMKEMCECFLELGSRSSRASPDGSKHPSIS